MPLRGTQIWDKHPEILEKPVSWTQNLRDYYARNPNQTTILQEIRLILSLFPWAFFGMAICHVVQKYIKRRELIDPLTAGLTAAKRLLPFWLGGALSIGLSIGWLSLISIRPLKPGDHWAYESVILSAFYLCVLGFGVAFVINLIYLMYKSANKAFQSENQGEELPISPLLKIRWMFSWAFWRVFEGLIAAFFAYIPMLVMALICHGIIGTLVFGFQPWIPMRQGAAAMAALSFIPMVALNAFFWTATTWMYIHIQASARDTSAS